MISNQSILPALKTAIQYVGVPLVLVTIALRQLVLVHNAGLSPWHGGGFGMFASIDRDEWRKLTTTVTACDGTQTSVGLSEVAQVLGSDAYTHLTTFPTSAQLQSAGQRLIQAQSSGDLPACIQQVQLQVSRLTFDGHAITYEPLSPLIDVQP